MLNRMLMVLTGVAMAISATGCCCSHYNRCCNPCGGYGYGAQYGSPVQCGPGGCAPTYGYPAGPTSYYSPTDAAFAPTTTLSAAPMFGPAYPTTTAFATTQSLPTY